MSVILPRVLSESKGSAWAGPNLELLATSEPLTEKFSGKVVAPVLEGVDRPEDGPGREALGGLQ
eukprot:11803611-Alexandrium_andersonii.AAC.1